MNSTKLKPISIVVMAVPERSDMLDTLLGKLDLDKSRVVWDSKHQGHLPTWERAVHKALADDPTHVMILEDDAQPARDILPCIKQLLDRFPDRVFSLYSNSFEVDKARQQNKCLIQTRHTLSDVAMVYQAAWLRELLDDYQKRSNEFKGLGADEMRVKLRPDLAVWSTVPSLVEHGAPKESTLGHTYLRQKARWALPSYRSALEIDWTRV